MYFKYVLQLLVFQLLHSTVYTVYYDASMWLTGGCAGAEFRPSTLRDRPRPRHAGPGPSTHRHPGQDLVSEPPIQDQATQPTAAAGRRDGVTLPRWRHRAWSSTSGPVAAMLWPWRVRLSAALSDADDGCAVDTHTPWFVAITAYHFKSFLHRLLLPRIRTKLQCGICIVPTCALRCHSESSPSGNRPIYYAGDKDMLSDQLCIGLRLSCWVSRRNILR